MNKEREAFNEWVEKHPDFRALTAYEESLMFDAWQAAKAMTDLGELQERIAGHQYYHGELGYLIVDMDDVVNEIQELAND